MEHFFDVIETVEPGMGFSIFGLTHLIELGLFALFAAIMIHLYKNGDENVRRKIRIIFAIAMLIDEAFKHICLLANGLWLPKYLPLHLCSINIFLIVIDAFKPNKTIRHFLVLLCFPGAVMALVSPSWQQLPVINFMHLHSYTVHVLLATYPLMIIGSKETKPELKYFGFSMIMLGIMLIPIYFINKALETNFFFLMNAGGNAIFLLFERLTGSHLTAFPVVGAILLPIMVMIWKFCTREKA